MSYSPWSALWTSPLLLFSAFIIAWGAEAGQFIVSQGMALAILAWLQTLPEFAVEAGIAWEKNVSLMTANFTGSIRLLVGLGIPMIYFTSVIFGKKGLNKIHLEKEHSIEILTLLPPLIYFVYILIKGSLNLFDGIVLILFYTFYIIILLKIPPKGEEEKTELAMIPKLIISLKGYYMHIAILGLFLIGGTILYFIVHPFIHSMMAIALAIGVSEYIFIQWVAPFLSEFPEKLSAFNWAKTVSKAPMGVLNMLSSNINQWTVLVGMLPFIYNLSAGSYIPIVFDTHQKIEIFLTLSQSVTLIVILLNMELNFLEASGLFILWFIQFLFPHTRETVILLYWLWSITEVFLYLMRRKKLLILEDFIDIYNKHILRGGEKS